MDELKPCPFCGASAVNVSGGDGRIYWFEHPTNECLLSGHEFDCGNDGKWLEQWNRRHPAVTGVPVEQWDIFIADYNRYMSGDQKMPFSLLRQSLASMIDSAAPTAQETRQEARDE